jgi:hypothetical protein
MYCLHLGISPAAHLRKVARKPRNIVKLYRCTSYSSEMSGKIMNVSTHLLVQNVGGEKKVGCLIQSDVPSTRHLLSDTVPFTYRFREIHNASSD